jgi:catechol 2,3-dioxygenase-like lactoylglutathione lyase family enzyme
MPNFIRITPFINVLNLEEALHFFVDILGFTLWVKAEGFAYVQRECAAFRILQTSPGNDFIPGNRRFAYYIDVKDVEAIYAELKPRLDTLSDGDVHGPKDKAYGQRELLIRAPDGNLLAFGQSIHPMPDAVYKSDD